VKLQLICLLNISCSHLQVFCRLLTSPGHVILHFVFEVNADLLQVHSSCKKKSGQIWEAIDPDVVATWVVVEIRPVVVDVVVFTSKHAGTWYLFQSQTLFWRHFIFNYDKIRGNRLNLLDFLEPRFPTTV
jgi:hypothetical protein